MTKGLVGGHLDIFVVRDVETFRGATDGVNRHVGVFTGADWEALFYDVLNGPEWGEYAGDGSFDEHFERQRVKFQQSIPDFPMLGRIFNMYEDVIYGPTDVKRLRDECLTTQASTTNTHTLEALNKLIHASDEALKVGLGLYLAAD